MAVENITKYNSLANDRTRWRRLEDRRIRAKRRPTDDILAEELGRTVYAIQKRRSRLNSGC